MVAATVLAAAPIAGRARGDSSRLAAGSTPTVIRADLGSAVSTIGRKIQSDSTAGPTVRSLRTARRPTSPSSEVSQTGHRRRAGRKPGCARVGESALQAPQGFHRSLAGGRQPRRGGPDGTDRRRRARRDAACAMTISSRASAPPVSDCAGGRPGLGCSWLTCVGVVGQLPPPLTAAVALSRAHW